MGQIFFAGEEPQEWPTLLCHMIAYGAFEHRITRLKRIEHRAHGNRIRNLELHLSANVCQRSQMQWNLNPYHGNVWTSTDSTAGRSRTIGAQLSPASDDAYTWPPVVPKYTPQESSESTAMASRSTFT